MERLDADRLLALRHLVRVRATAGPTTALPGSQTTRRRGGGLELADLREFTHGDDPRHLDRNATARLGVPHVRTFHAERDLATLLVVDLRPSMFWGTRRTFRSVAAAEAAVIRGWQAVASGGRVGAIALSSQGPAFAPIRSGARAMADVIGMIVRSGSAEMLATKSKDPPLAEALSVALRLAPRGAEVVIASSFDGLGEEFDAIIVELAGRTRPTILRIADPFETSMPRGRYSFLTRVGVGGTVSAATMDSPDLPAILQELRLDCTLYDSSLTPETVLGHA